MSPDESVRAGDLIRAARLYAGLSHAGLADKLGLGLSSIHTLVHFEDGSLYASGTTVREVLSVCIPKETP